VPGKLVVDKPGKGAFHATDLDAMLKNRGITQLIVCGVTTEVCVNTTVREANDRGYEYVVVEDCVGSYFPEFQEMGLRMIKAQGGIFGWVTHPRRSSQHFRNPAGEETTMNTSSDAPRWGFPEIGTGLLGSSPMSF
jgi:nicotinamidase-related amidase